MPARSPEVGTSQQDALQRLGARIKDRRRQLGLSAATCAEAAGLSRVTLHRIEAGNASVTIGAYLNVITALGLTLTIPIVDDPAGDGVRTVRVGDYPGLRSLAWQTGAGTEITETEALNLYERGWRHLDRSVLDDDERLFIQHLADVYSHGKLLV
ncbi:MAG: helix-turn-helix transcriptional regulator [Nocardioidaceae bacterium]|nr:helix-turn-helix transcriptional regulator [Nocardioidaceae bacterium]MCL2612138.1 helix-turn-helix transcriptional regulator [Nocardioidaceae bacterium]